MALKTIQFRRDTAANFAFANPILVSGEPGFETNTGKLKLGDGSTAWNSLPYLSGGASAFTDLTDVPSSYTGEAGKLLAVNALEDALEFIATPGSVHAGTATLASGTVTVEADWVTADTVIVVTAQAAPLIPGTNLYVDPANIVVGVSFDISSDDGTDTRDIFWITTEPAAVDLGADVFYVEFPVIFDSTDRIFLANSEKDIFRINIDVDPFEDCFIGFYSSSGGTVHNLFAAFDAGDFPVIDEVVTINADTEYVVGMKVERSSDHKTVDVEVKVDASVIGTMNVVLDHPWVISDFALGLVASAGIVASKFSFDYFKIGTTGYGTSDLFSADFGTDEAPFDSLSDGSITVTGGSLVVDTSASGTHIAYKSSTIIP